MSSMKLKKVFLHFMKFFVVRVSILFAYKTEFNM